MKEIMIVDIPSVEEITIGPSSYSNHYLLFPQASGIRIDSKTFSIMLTERYLHLFQTTHHYRKFSE